jgi:hypothetical protein
MPKVPLESLIDASLDKWLESSGDSLPAYQSTDSDGNLVWRSILVRDHALAGELLVCHLAIEHYMDVFLNVWCGPQINWKEARLSFHQKLSLLSGNSPIQAIGCVPGIKQLNSIRNQIAHNLEASIDSSDVAPLVAIMNAKQRGKRDWGDEKPVVVIRAFATMVCGALAGAIATAKLAQHGQLDAAEVRNFLERSKRLD